MAAPTTPTPRELPDGVTMYWDPTWRLFWYDDEKTRISEWELPKLRPLHAMPTLRVDMEAAQSSRE